MMSIHPDAEIGWMAGLIFQGSREFLRVYEMLSAYRQSPPVRAARAPTLLRPWVVCASFALELAFKARIAVEGAKPPTTHRYPELFRKLTAEAQADVARRLAKGDRPASVQEVSELLTSFGNPFEDWRYLHERLARLELTSFHEGEMIAVIHALHQSTLERRPDFTRWVGVIQEEEP